MSCCYRGYIEAVREIEQQIQLSGDVQFDDIVVACGRYFSDTCYFLHCRVILCICFLLFDVYIMEVVILPLYDLMIKHCAVVEQLLVLL